MKNKWKKLEVFCIFGISTHLSFLGSIFSFFFIYFSFFYHLLFVFWSYIVYFSSFLFISHHVLCFFHWSLVFCSIFDQEIRKKWRTLSKIQGFWAQDRKMKKNMIKKWKINEKNSRFFAFLGFQLICLFLAPFFHCFFIYFSFFYHLFFVFLSYIVHFSSFLSISHHVLCFFHWFPVFCSIFDQKIRKKWRTLSKIQGVWAQDRKMKKTW